MALPTVGTAQDKTPDIKHNHASKPADADKDLIPQLRELKAKVATLEAALAKRYPGEVGRSMMGATGMTGDQKMGMGMMGMVGMEAMKPDEMMGQMMQKMGEMMQMMSQMRSNGTSSMGDKQKMGMGMMGPKGSGMMDMDMQEMMGMMGMGGMGQKGRGMGKIQMTAALPGFPGASHIYHIGATGFFLDHPDHIKLTIEQQTELNADKEKALLEKSSSQRKIDEAEQELWMLTGSDKPDAAKIESKVRGIEKLRADQRMAFIRAVGEAAKLLTDEQRQVLLGHSKPEEHKH
jgi:Spy/CpxP family protein refolding chaperone